MESTGLLTISLSAFLAVFIILSLLAVFMRLMMLVFPAKELKEDVAVIAALTSVVQKFNPGKNITKIEEVK